MAMNRLSTFALCIAASLSLAACQTASSVDAETVRTSKIDSVLERAASNAASRGETSSSLAILEKMYKRNSSDPAAAMRYARALREADYLNRSAMVLSPYAHDEKSSVEIKTEFTAIQLALGHYKAAEEFAQKAIIQDPESYQAFHHLGIALDAQGMHKEAERAFRKGLDYWQGDPTSIMNNLALNLTAQGFLDEASEILQKAAALSPEREEIERNLRIITALQQTGARITAPKPDKKPVALIE